MLAPPPVIVHVPDEKVVLPSIPYTDLPARPTFSSADCARTKLALTLSAHTSATADRAPPRICLVVKVPLQGDLSRALYTARFTSNGRVAFQTPQL